MSGRITDFQSKTSQDIDALLNDTELRHGLLMGKLKPELVPVFSEDVKNKMKNFLGFIDQAQNGGYIPTTDEAIALIRTAETIYNDLSISIEEIAEERDLLTEEKERIKKKLDYGQALTSYIIKRYVLIPIFSDEQRRQELTEKVNPFPDGDTVKESVLDLIEREAFLPFDALSLIAPDLFRMGKMTEQEINKALYDFAYKESIVLETDEGTSEAEMPTERQKKYIRLRMGDLEGVAENAKQN